jgi:hypothetical protein
MSTVEPSYVALRAVFSPGAEPWWKAALGSDDVPGAVAALIRGRTRVELSAAEADATLTWAAGLAGWAEAEPKPLVVYGRA